MRKTYHLPGMKCIDNYTPALEKTRQLILDIYGKPGQKPPEKKSENEVKE